MAFNVTNAVNVFTAGYKCILNALTNNATLGTNLGHVNDWSTINTPPLTSLSPSDCVELSIVQTSDGARVANALAVEIQQTYAVVLVTDMLNIEPLNSCKMGAISALLSATFTADTWNSQRFIQGQTITLGSDGATGGIVLPGLAGQANRGVNREINVASVTLTMFMGRDSLPQ